jgi:hypothetical protein
VRRFFDSDLVKRIHAHLHVGNVNAIPSDLTHLDVVIDALTRQDLRGRLQNGSDVDVNVSSAFYAEALSARRNRPAYHYLTAKLKNVVLFCIIRQAKLLVGKSLQSPAFPPMLQVGGHFRLGFLGSCRPGGE